MFRSAVLKLTGWYLLIIMLISLFFSLALFSVTNNDLQRNVFHPRPGMVFYGGTANDYQEQLQAEFDALQQREILTLVRFNIIVLVLAGGASYFLAGRTLRPLETAMEAQSRFTGDASHELRTPLTAMRSEIEVSLRDPKLSLAESKHLLESNLEEVVKLEALSQALLQLARFSSGRGQFEMAELDLADPVKAAVERIEKRATERRISIDVALKHINLRANHASLTELFVTLLDNAVKYGKDGGRIDISVKAGSGEATVTITDDGIGINAADLPHIFDRFYRADTSRSRQHTEGYGLGLSLAAQIAHIHRGSITAKSVEGEGSTFIVRLPRAQNVSRLRLSKRTF